MKALTLKHPWPFAILFMGKDIENRIWKPPVDLYGKRFAIHGGEPPKGKEYDLFKSTAESLLDRFGKPLFWLDDDSIDQMILPGIVATVTLTHLVTTNDGGNPWYDGPPSFGWHIQDVRILPDGIKIKGKQRLWNIPKEISDELETV